jgi:hypothetical protein
MTLRPCPHEPEIRRLFELGHWAQSCPPELRAHAASCRVCGDLILVSQTFRSARAASLSAPQLPPAGVLWWRAQLRRRNAAVERINKPIFGAQVFALGITLVVALWLIGWQARESWVWLSSTRAGFNSGFKSGLASGFWAGFGDWVASISRSQAFHFQALVPLSAIKAGVSLMYLVPGLVMLALISGVVLYLASEKQ